MAIPGLACRSAGRCQRCPRASARRIEAVRCVGYYQGRARLPRLIATHWSRRLRLAYVTGFRQGQLDRLRDLEPMEPAGGQPAVLTIREAR